MRYWAHINNEVRGPFEKEALGGTPGFTPATLVCPETPPAGEPAAWRAASAIPEVLAALTPAPVPAPAPVQSPAPARPVQQEESPLALTMRGSLITDPVFSAPLPKEPAPAAPKTFAVNSGTLEAPKEAAAAPDPRLEQLGKKLAEAGAELAAAAGSQAELAARLQKAEAALREMKALLGKG